LEQVSGAFSPIICPAFELLSTEAAIPEFDAAIFTSRAAVSFAPNGQGRPAYCVGAATATAAQDANYVATSADGSAADLCALILEERPPLKLLHVRGEVSLGNVMRTLRTGGLNCAEVVSYCKNVLSVESIDLAVVQNVVDTIFPVFSAETVSILRDWPYDFGLSHIVAISSEVADVATQLNPASITISDRPNLPSMVACTSRLIA
jgi:uroporphyrinogen-III synthase